MSLKTGTITDKEYREIVRLAERNIATSDNKEILSFYNKLHMLTLIFKLFWDEHPSVDHIPYLNILLYRRFTEICSEQEIKQAQILVDVMDRYLIEGVTKKNVYQISYLIQNFFIDREINDELLLTYFTLYTILCIRYIADNKKKINMNIDLSSAHISEETREKIIEKIKLFNMDRIDITKDREFDEIINMSRSIYRYFLAEYIRMRRKIAL